VAAFLVGEAAAGVSTVEVAAERTEMSLREASDVEGAGIHWIVRPLAGLEQHPRQQLMMDVLAASAEGCWTIMRGGAEATANRIIC